MYVYKLIQELVKFDSGRDVKAVVPLNGKPLPFDIIQAREFPSLPNCGYVGLDIGKSIIENGYDGHSRMCQVARLFGKQLLDEFKIKNAFGSSNEQWARFTAKGFQIRPTVACEWRDSDSAFRRLLTGETCLY